MNKIENILEEFWYDDNGKDIETTIQDLYKQVIGCIPKKVKTDYKTTELVRCKEEATYGHNEAIDQTKKNIRDLFFGKGKRYG